MYFCLQGGSDNSFHMAVGTNSGATRAQQVGGIEQGSDGIAMFYREVPASANFTLSADITINAYNASVLNSFGLMVRDDIYLDTVSQRYAGRLCGSRTASALLCFPVELLRQKERTAYLRRYSLPRLQGR